MQIEIVSGSPRKESLSFRVALHLQQQISSISTHSVNIIDVREWHFPLLQEVISSPETAPEHLQPLAKRMFAAQSFILVTPEYNGTYTAALKNLFDHFPKQSHKAFGVVTASPGAMGGMRNPAQQQRFLPGMCTGDIIGALAITEPNTGSDVGGVRTTAVKHGDTFVVNGAKTFISNGIYRKGAA